MNHRIDHDETKYRFFCRIDGKECAVDYEPKQGTPKILDIYRTFVHPDLRGKGIAEKLLGAISDYALKQGLTIVPSCSYAVTYYRRHPEFAGVLAKGVDLENGGSCRVGNPRPL